MNYCIYIGNMVSIHTWIHTSLLVLASDYGLPYIVRRTYTVYGTRTRATCTCDRQPLSRLIRNGIPPDCRIHSLLMGSYDNSAMAPTTFTSTFSEELVNRFTSWSMVRRLCRYTTFSSLMAHFHTAPVTATNSSGLVSLFIISTMGSRPGERKESGAWLGGGVVWRRRD